MNELVTIDNSKCELNQTGLIVKGDIEPGDWKALGQQLTRVAGCLQWWLGDWLNYGEAKYGEKYAHAAEVTGLQADTLRHYAYVCRNVKAWVRTHGVGFQHHHIVVSLEAGDQVYWLARAVTNKWSASQLRQELRKANQAVQPVSEPKQFNPMAWSHEFVRWWKRTEREEPVESWPEARREALKSELKPLVEVYQALSS